MKLHKPLVNTILDALHKIINENFYSDKVLEYIFRHNKKLGKRDRQFIAETTYNIVRYYYYYKYIANDTSLEKILYTYFQINKIHFDNFKPPFQIPKIDTLTIPEQIHLSYNDELWNEGIQSLGYHEWLKEAKALNIPASLVIRANTLKITPEDLAKELAQLNIQTKFYPEVPEALIITNKLFLSQNHLFKSGLYEFQDISSQKVAHFIPYDILEKSKIIIDACAGAGGKSLHLSALKKNKGKIIAMDVDEKKLKELRKRSARAGCSNIQIKHITSSKVIKRLKEKADILLIDAPCSGTGVIKRNPDTKLKFSSTSLQELINLQKQILNDYSTMLKPDGYLLYVTCSILKKENEQQVENFLSQHPEFQLIKQQTILPSSGFDGFYIALLKKCGN